jgi:hypothetical protein
MPIFDLANPTQLIFEWGWFLMTRANFVVYALLLVVFLLGILVPLPRSKGEQ